MQLNQAVNSYIEKSNYDMTSNAQRRAAFSNYAYGAIANEDHNQGSPTVNDYILTAFPYHQGTTHSGEAHTIAYRTALVNNNLVILEPLLRTSDITIPVIIAFRGTADIYDVMHDVSLFTEWATGASQFNLFNSKFNEYLSDINDYLDNTNETSNIELVGHSLGGLFALYTFHALMQSNTHSQRVSMCTGFNPYLLSTNTVREVYDVCADPLNPHHESYRAKIQWHVIRNDFASIMLQTPAAFANVTLYPSVAYTEDYYATLSGVPYADYLTSANHGLANFNFTFIHKLTENISFTKNTQYNIKSVRTGSLINYITSNTPVDESLYLYSDDGDEVNIKVSHPEVHSTFYENYQWTYRGPLLETNEVDTYANEIAFFHHFSNPTTNIYLGFIHPPVGSDPVMLDAFGIRQRTAVPVDTTYIGLWANSLNSITLPQDIKRLIQYPDSGSTDLGQQRFSWLIDSNLYSHAGHRRSLPFLSPISVTKTVSATINNHVMVLAGYQQAHGYWISPPFAASNTVETMLAPNNNKAVYAYWNEGLWGTDWYDLNIDISGSALASPNPDEFTWLIEQQAGTLLYTITNTEQGQVFTNMIIEPTSVSQEGFPTEARIGAHNSDGIGQIEWWTVTNNANNHVGLLSYSSTGTIFTFNNLQ